MGTDGAVVTRIAGTGHYAPDRVLTNDDLAEIVDTSDEWIRTRTGIRQRRIAADGEYTSDLAANAAREAVESAGLTPEDIDLIVVCTVTPDMPLPSTAVYVQQKIGARSDCPAFDLAAACSGFIYGLSVADSFIRSGSAKHVLIIGVELLSRVLDWQERTTCVLFGDGAGAAVLSAAEPGCSRELLSTHIFANGELAPALTIPAGGSVEPASEETVANGRHFVHMAGRDVFKFAVKALSAASKLAVAENGLEPDDIAWVIPHQANLRILEGVSKRCGIPMERFFVNIDRYGNTSSASVPIAMNEASQKGCFEQGQYLLLCALGGGIAWGSALVRW